MGRRSSLRHFLVPLLALLLLGASAAAPAPERAAVRAARIALDRGDSAAASRIIDDALTRVGAGAGEDVWALRVLRGELLFSGTDYKGADKALAFELPPNLKTSQTAIRHLVMRAFTLKRLDQVPRARELLESAKTLAATHHPEMLAEVEFALASVTSNDQQAREAARLARKYGRKDVEAKALASLAFALARRQQYAESIQYGQQALALARSVGMLKTLQQIEGNLGWSYREIGDYENAEVLFTRSKAAAERMGLKADRVPWLIQLGNLREERRDWAAAERYNTQAAALARETAHDDQLGMALANLARIAIATGRFADARKLNAEALQYKKDDPEAELRSYILEAHILGVVEGKHDAAQKLLNRILRETKRSMTVAEAAAELAQVHLRTNRRDLAEAQFKRALAAARDARDEVKDAELRLSLFNTIRDIFGEYVDFLAIGNRRDDALALTETRRAQTLEEGLTVPSKLDASAVARQNDATILCYWLGRDRSYLWAVTRDDVRLHVLPPDTTIEKTADQYRRELLGPFGSLKSGSGSGQALYRMLIEPAAKSIGKGSRVIVIADGKLHALNFETLVVPSPQPHYWIEDVIVMNASSLQLLARAPRKPGQAPAMLLVGNAPSPDPSFPALLHAAAEMRAIEKRFPDRTVLEGANATPAAYNAAAPGKFAYVHFVAHGEATREHPLDSAVILARDASSRYKLLAREVLAQPLTAKLVTISSCYGAGTRTYAGEGIVGLAWAFLRAGADQVIAALWEVNDVATPLLMDRMYAGIRAGKDPVVALRDAKLQFVRGTGSYRRPIHWAPFVLYAGT
jgi:CHAT domain-containing protein/tetratricopeptide (TPR) repeat protein